MCIQNEKFLFYLKEVRKVINNYWKVHFKIRKVINNSGKLYLKIRKE
jgi:hypothetical protein